MRRIVNKIKSLIRRDAVHNRKNFKLADVTLEFILSQAQAEFDELKDAPDDESEMADLLGILVHYCIKQGWTMDLIESKIIEKLELRFSVVKAD